MARHGRERKENMSNHRSWGAQRFPRFVIVSAAALLTLMGSSALAQADSYRLYVANEFSADITVIDTSTNEVIGTITISGRPGEVRPRGMAVSPDGTPFTRRSATSTLN